MSIRYFATNRDRENLGQNRFRKKRISLQKGGYHFVNMQAYMSYYLSEVDAKSMPEEVIVENSPKEVFDNFLGNDRIGSVVVCVHGFNVHFHQAQTWFGILTDSLMKCECLRGKIVTDPLDKQQKKLLTGKNTAKGSLTAFIGFSWPSNGSVFSYLGDQREALGSASILGNIILRLRRLKNKPSVNLICHSMGNFLTCHMLKKMLEEEAGKASKELRIRLDRLQDQNVPPGERYFIDRYIMLAADVERRHVTKCVTNASKIGKDDEATTYIGPFYSGLEHLAGQVHNFYSRFDGALAISNLEKVPRKLVENSKGFLDKVTFGMLDFLEKNPDHKWEQRLGATQHPMIAPPNMQSHNTTELSGREIGHSDYVDSMEIVDAIAQVLSLPLK